MKNKKSQIASTLTWFTATIIIFFIMVLFLTTSILSSQKKKVTSGWDEVKLENFSGNYENQEVLSFLLNTNFEIENETHLLKDWLSLDIYNMEESKKALLREKIKEEIISFIGFNGGKECYLFSAISGVENNPTNPDNLDNSKTLSDKTMQFIDKNSIEFSSYYNPPSDNLIVKYSNSHKQLLRRSSNIVLSRDNKQNVFGIEEKDYIKVNVRFYIGEC